MTILVRLRFTPRHSSLKWPRSASVSSVYFVDRSSASISDGVMVPCLSFSSAVRASSMRLLLRSHLGDSGMNQIKPRTIDGMM